MNKNAIFNYVEFAREELQKLVRQKAFEYGITEKGAEANVLIVNGRLLTKEESTQECKEQIIWRKWAYMRCFISFSAFLYYPHSL